jgi:hypothetical protein
MFVAKNTNVQMKIMPNNKRARARVTSLLTSSDEEENEVLGIGYKIG